MNFLLMVKNIKFPFKKCLSETCHLSCWYKLRSLTLTSTEQGVNSELPVVIGGRKIGVTALENRQFGIASLNGTFACSNKPPSHLCIHIQDTF